ncbi:pilin [Candidatus Saccharibacteria bacterium]|nr:pilin [Candidatus Saccharibacteria bacterium]
MKRLIFATILYLTTLFSSLALAPSLQVAAINCGQSGLSAKQQIQCGACGAAGETQTSCDPSSAPGTINNTVKTAINILSVAAGIAAVIMLMVGGFRYVTSSGNAESAKAAKNTIVYAIIGLVIVALAQVIVRFVLHNTATVTTKTSTSNTGSTSVSEGAANSPH